MSAFDIAVNEYIKEHGSIDSEAYESLQQVFCEGKIINTAKNAVSAVGGGAVGMVKSGVRGTKHLLRAIIDTPDQAHLQKARDFINDAIKELDKCESIDMDGMASKLESLSNAISMNLKNPKAKEG